MKLVPSPTLLLNPPAVVPGVDLRFFIIMNVCLSIILPLFSNTFLIIIGNC